MNLPASGSIQPADKECNESASPVPADVKDAFMKTWVAQT